MSHLQINTVKNAKTTLYHKSRGIPTETSGVYHI